MPWAFCHVCIKVSRQEPVEESRSPRKEWPKQMDRTKPVEGDWDCVWRREKLSLMSPERGDQSSQPYNIDRDHEKECLENRRELLATQNIIRKMEKSQRKDWGAKSKKSQEQKKLVNRRERIRKLKNHPRRSNIQIMGVSRQKELWRPRGRN